MLLVSFRFLRWGRLTPLARLTCITVLALAAMICASQPGHAQAQPAATTATTPPGDAPLTVSLGQSLQNWLNQPTMTGDWGGLRTRLGEDGFNLRASYIGEYAYNFAGGKRIGGDYAQQFAFGMDVDMGKVAGLTGGTFHLSFNVREGRNTTADFIGNKIDVQEIYGDGNNFRLAEMSYEQSLFKDALNLKAGFTVMGDDFGRTSLLCDFENDAFCAHANSLPTNSGWSDYPAGKWGGRVRVNLPDDVYVEAGVYDVNPTYAEHDNGFKLSLNGSTGALIPFEISKTLTIGPAALPGHYKIGGYYDTSSAPNLANPDTMLSGRYGGYVLIDQMIWSFQPNTDRGVIVVADATISDKRTASIPTYFVAALVAQGPFTARPHDFIAIGYVRDMVNNNAMSHERALLTAQNAEIPEFALGENILEVGYGLQATPWMLIHPNLQYVGNPGAFSFESVPNAWVFGAQLKVIL
jgi:porin